MRRTHRFELGDRTYEMTQLQLRDARDLRMRLVRTLGPSLGQIVSASGTTTLQSRAAGAAVQKLAEALSPEDLDWAFEKFCRVTQFIKEQSGKEFQIPLDNPETVAEHFEGDRLFHADELVVVGLQLNFRQYFLSLTRSLKIDERWKAAMTAWASRSPNASTGTSGDSSPVKDSQ